MDPDEDPTVEAFDTPDADEDANQYVVPGEILDEITDGSE